MSCAEAAWEKGLSWFPPHSVHALLCWSFWIYLFFSPLLQLLLCWFSPLQQWLVYVFPLPMMWRGSGPQLGSEQLYSSPSLAFQSCSSPKYPLLNKSLGKRSNEAAAQRFSWTHMLPGALRGEAKVNPLEAKRESCTMCFFLLFVIRAVKWELPFLLSVWRGKEEKKEIWKMLASNKIQRSSFSCIVNELLSAFPFVKALNPACK